MTNGRDTSRGARAAAVEVALRGRRAWPTIVIDDDRFAAYVAERVPVDVVASELHEDLYLACGCIDGVAAATEALEREIMVDVPKAIRRVDRDPDFVAEVTADLRLALIDGAGGLSVVERYRGTGPLRSFVMVLAMRRAIDRKRRQREVTTDPGTLAVTPTDDPGIARVDADSLRRAFAAALKDRLAALPPRDRNVLRLHVIDGIPAEAIARMYGVHRATVTRWIAHAKQTILDETRGALAERFKLSKDSFDSFARQEAIAFETTLSTFLRSSG